MSEYYPAGTLNAKGAPWNRDEDEEFVCPECGEPVTNRGALCRACELDWVKLERWERRRDDD